MTENQIENRINKMQVFESQHKKSVTQVDIAPAFRQLLKVSPLEVLQTMKNNLKESGYRSPMMIAVLSDIDNELLKRINGQMAQSEVKIEDIKIIPCFEEHPPKAEKMEQKRQHFRETGLLQSEIILDSGNNLIDGYASYLLAKENNIDCVPIRHGKRQIVRAYHRKGGELYTWELPGLLVDRVSAGDKVIVHTQRGIKTVTVAAVEEYNPEEYPDPLRTVIRRKKKVRAE